MAGIYHLLYRSSLKQYQPISYVEKGREQKRVHPAGEQTDGHFRVPYSLLKFFFLAAHALWLAGAPGAPARDTSALNRFHRPLCPGILYTHHFPLRVMSLELDTGTRVGQG